MKNQPIQNNIWDAQVNLSTDFSKPQHRNQSYKHCTCSDDIKIVESLQFGDSVKNQTPQQYVKENKSYQFKLDHFVDFERIDRQPQRFKKSEYEKQIEARDAAEAKEIFNELDDKLGDNGYVSRREVIFRLSSQFESYQVIDMLDQVIGSLRDLSNDDFAELYLSLKKIMRQRIMEAEGIEDDELEYRLLNKLY